MGRVRWVGDVFAGRYELVDPLGEGGTGVVWRVWDHRAHRYCAAKVLRQVDASSLVRFVREQGVRVQHSHLLVPYGWAGDDERVMLVMPVVDGGSAATLLAEHGPLPAPWVATLTDQLLQGLGQLHDGGMVHRDVKPANLLLDATGTGVPRARLADFGLTMSVDAPRLTTGPYVHGTLGYMAPESLAHGWDPSPAADLYGVGMTARELLTGQRPQGRDHDAVAGELARAGVPDGLARVLEELVELDPADRPRSAQAAMASLRATGLVATTAEQLGGGVALHDRLPALPAGWTPQGPAQDRGQVPAGPPQHATGLPPAGAARTTMYDVPEEPPFDRFATGQEPSRGPLAEAPAGGAQTPDAPGPRRVVGRAAPAEPAATRVWNHEETPSSPVVPPAVAWGLVLAGLLVLLVVLVAALG